MEIFLPLAEGTIVILKETGAFEKVWDFIKGKKSYPILLVGASGTGKTSLLKALQGEATNIRRQDRTDDIKKVSGKIEGVPLKILDTPGEVFHNSIRLRAYQEALHEKSIGILNVASFGYHEGRTEASKAVKDGKASEEYLEERRKIEVSLINEWAPILCDGDGPCDWLVTVVTKADLWWNKGPDQPTIQYYENGPYQDIIGKYGSTPHSAKSYSSTDGLFYDQVPMSGYYSSKLRKADHDSLVAHILDKVATHGQ